MSELGKSLKAFKEALKMATLNADTLLAVQDALDSKNSNKLRSALGELRGEKAAVYLLNAMKRKAVNVNEALKILGG